MRSIFVRGSASVLVWSALAIGCVEAPSMPIGYTPAVAAATAHPEPGVTSTQPTPPPSDQEPPEPAVESPAEPHPTGQSLPTHQPPPDGRTRAARVVSLASLQVDRLRRMENSGNDSAPRADVDTMLGELETKRDDVLQDLREIELRPAQDVLAKLDQDVARLWNAVRASYSIAPPPSQGLAQPSPLPPSQAW